MTGKPTYRSDWGDWMKTVEDWVHQAVRRRPRDWSGKEWRRLVDLYRISDDNGWHYHYPPPTGTSSAVRTGRGTLRNRTRRPSGARTRTWRGGRRSRDWAGPRR